MLYRLKGAVLALVALFAGIQHANATLILFTDRAAFEAAADVALSFEGFNDAAQLSDDLTLSAKRFRSTTSLVSEGEKALSVSEEGAFTVGFGHDVFAFGFDLNELNSTNLTYTDSAGHEIFDALKVTPVWNESTFFGVLSDVAITSFTLTGAGDSRAVYGFDALAYTAAPVSNAPMHWILIAGLAALVLSRKKKSFLSI